MAEHRYYDGTKLLSLTDLTGKKPELYMAVGNRSIGKTTYFNRMVVNRFKKTGAMFGLIFRFPDEIDHCDEKFFGDIGTLFFKGDEMKYQKMARGKFAELLLNDVVCGYAICLNAADTVKKYSHLFDKVECLVFDEFQSETNHYCIDEITKFLSVHTSIARGGGQLRRYVPVYMLSNEVTMLNPYYAAMDIGVRLRHDTKYLRGNGWVLEQGFYEEAANAIADSGVSRAFAGSKYVEASTAQNVYLNDNYAFIEKPVGRSKYLCTLKFNGTEYGVRSFPDLGIVYCDNRPDSTFKGKIAVTTDDHNINYVMLKTYQLFLETIRYYFDVGCFRFRDLSSKQCILTALSYV